MKLPIFIDNVRTEIEGQRLDDAANLIQDFVHNLYYDPFSIGEVFGSRELDNLCLLIGKKVNEHIVDSQILDQRQESDVGIKIAIICSHIDGYGGHGMIIKDLLQKKFEGKIILLVTDIYKTFDRKAASIIESVDLRVVKGVSLEEKIERLSSELRNICPDKIVLFNHHHDVVAIASIQPWLSKKNIIFYHHADHHLSLGVHIPGAIHIDPHNIGFYNCRQHEGHRENLYFPLVVRLSDEIKSQRLFSDSESLNTCSSGSYLPKFGGQYPYSYLEFIAKRLSIRDGNHTHIGDIPDEEKKSLDQLLELHKIDVKRFIHIPWVDSLSSYMAKQSIDLYISSFPVAGGRASIEAMAVGLPLLMHSSVRSRFMGGGDIVYPEAFLWRNQEEFNNIIKQVTKGELLEHSKKAKLFYLNNYSEDKFYHWLTSDKSLDRDYSIPVPSLHTENSINYLEKYLNRESKSESELRGNLEYYTLKTTFLVSKNQNLDSKNQKLKLQEAALHHEIHSTHVRLSEAMLEISRMGNSLSWKITRPLRVFGFLKRKMKIDRIQELRRNLKFVSHEFPYIKLLNSLLLGRSEEYESCLKDYEELYKIILALKNTGLASDVKFSLITDIWKTLIARVGIDISILFDHNGGGGSNLYSRELIKEGIQGSKNIFRIYYFEKFYFLECYGLTNKLIFYTESIDKLFATLERLKIKTIVINSVYGQPDIDSLISKVNLLKNNNNIFLDIKIHDFLTLCPSPHLLNSRNEYCQVPNDLSTCNQCLKTNKNWYHRWYPEDKIPLDVSLWRKPFGELLKTADKVVFFDQSSVEILSKGIDFDLDKVEITPHKIFHINCESPIETSGQLHIGTLGTLSPVKGLEVIRMLGDFVDMTNQDIQISVIGNVTSTLPDSINIYGEYESQNLPNIVRELGVNVIFMASIVPETFSYTLSEAMQMQLPILAFDLGAQGNRVGQYQYGEIIPLDSNPVVILEALQRLYFLKAKKERT